MRAEHWFGRGLDARSGRRLGSRAYQRGGRSRLLLCWNGVGQLRVVVPVMRCPVEAGVTVSFWVMAGLLLAATGR